MTTFSSTNDCPANSLMHSASQAQRIGDAARNGLNTAGRVEPPPAPEAPNTPKITYTTVTAGPIARATSDCGNIAPTASPKLEHAMAKSDRSSAKSPTAIFILVDRCKTTPNTYSSEEKTFDEFVIA